MMEFYKWKSNSTLTDKLISEDWQKSETGQKDEKHTYVLTKTDKVKHLPHFLRSLMQNF